MSTTLATITVTNNNDTGSVKVPAGTLPKELAINQLRPVGLSMLVEGETKERAVTYVMGSDKKGYSLCCKGSGPFPVAFTFTLNQAE